MEVGKHCYRIDIPPAEDDTRLINVSKTNASEERALSTDGRVSLDVGVEEGSLEAERGRGTWTWRRMSLARHDTSEAAQGQVKLDERERSGD